MLRASSQLEADKKKAEKREDSRVPVHAFKGMPSVTYFFQASSVLRFASSPDVFTW